MQVIRKSILLLKKISKAPIILASQSYHDKLSATFPSLPVAAFGTQNLTKGSTEEGSSLEHDFENVEIPLAGSTTSIEVHPMWLRHHCQCSLCFNHSTYQRINIPSLLPNVSEVREIRPTLNRVTITWNDDHKSTFDVNWLVKNIPKKMSGELSCSSNRDYKNNRRKSAFLIQDIPSRSTADPLAQAAVEFEHFMNPTSEAGVAKLLENIVTFGYGIVKNAPADFEKTKNVVRRISHPQNTIFGDFSDWTSNLAHADTAYTSDFVHLHTDTSYFSEPMGLQMFHCLKHEGTGGINSIVDGFHVAEKFADKYPELYSTLAESIVPAQYLDPGKHYFYSHDVTLKHDLFTGLIERVRYNPHDMGIINTIPTKQIGTFYKGLVRLSKEIESNPVWLKLSPGIIIFLDNWRVLHGRSEFTGFRHLCGAYIGRSDWLSKARTLGVISL